MKKLLLCFIALTLGLGLKAQCPLTTAVDFTAIDCHNTEVHLFDILDNGQYVLIDFFFTTCGPCQQVTPKIVESYSAFGCNMHDVFYMEISPSDANQACQNWANNYGVEYPTIGTNGGGSTICNQYGIGQYPTIILIRPDHSIAIQDLWPVGTTQVVINALQAQGVQQHDCNPSTYDPQVTISVDLVAETEVVATFTPNDDCAAYYYTMATESEIQQWMATAGLALPEYLQSYGFPGENEPISHTFTDLTPNTEYMIYAVPADVDGNLYDVVQEAVTTTSGAAEIMPDFTGTDLNGNEIHLYDILDAGQAVFINFFLTGDEFSEAVMPDVIEAYHLYGCNIHDVFFMEISSNGHDDACQAWVEQFGVEYPTISRDGGGNTIAQSIPVALYPALMLIRPNHEIAARDIYPPSLEYIVDAMESEGYEQSPCNEETLTFSIDTIYVEPMELTWITVYNYTNEDANITEILSENLKFTLDGQQFSYGWDMSFNIQQGESLELGLLLDKIAKDYSPETVTLKSNLPDAVFVAMVNHPVSVEETKSTYTLSPNPADERLTIQGLRLGTVSVYNALGQLVETFVAEGHELNINTAKYESGVYFIKSGEQVFRFVITH